MRIVLVACLAAAGFAADNSTPAVTSAASPQVGITADSLASVFASNLSTMTQVSPGPPWPNSLGDITSVTVTDSAGNQQPAQILFISPNQMNVHIPAGIAPGPAVVSFPTTGLPPGAGTAALRSVPVNIQAAAPALFSADGTGTGPAAATGIRVVIPTQFQSAVPVVQCTASSGCQALAIDVGVDAPVYLSFYGTGIRGTNVSVTIGNTQVSPTYVGPQSQTPGLDQVNVPLPLSLRGAGLVNVTVTAGGITSNAVQVRIL